MNRFERRKAAANKRTTITKKTPFGRLLRASEYDEETNKQTLVHATRGSTRRVLTPQLMAQLSA